jgi:riboflavin biosynthesis pyrimidine reductase
MGEERERDAAVVQRLEPLDALFDEASGEPLPLPPELLAFYGPLRMTSRTDRPHVFANFVASVDGIVAVDPPRGNGAAISGGNAHDRAVMGLLRAVADAVVIGAGNLRAESDHVWTAERICPELTRPYAELRAALGKPPAPLQIIVSATGDVDLSRAVFSGGAPSVVVTSAAGATRLRSQHPRRMAVHEPGDGWIPLAAVLELANVGPGALVLVESGPTSTTRYLADGAVDEIFLTIAPIFVGGRAGAPPTLALLEREFFPPGTLRGRLLSARRAGSFLLLRYGLG